MSESFKVWSGQQCVEEQVKALRAAGLASREKAMLRVLRWYESLGELETAQRFVCSSEVRSGCDSAGLSVAALVVADAAPVPAEEALGFSEESGQVFVSTEFGADSWVMQGDGPERMVRLVRSYLEELSVGGHSVPWPHTRLSDTAAVLAGIRGGL